MLKIEMPPPPSHLGSVASLYYDQWIMSKTHTKGTLTSGTKKYTAKDRHSSLIKVNESHRKYVTPLLEEIIRTMEEKGKEGRGNER